MLKMTTTSRHLDAATTLGTIARCTLDDGDAVFEISWDPRVQLISFDKISGSKNRLVTLRMVGVSIRDAKADQPVFGLYRPSGVLTAYNDGGNLILSLPVIELQCVSDGYIILPFSEAK